MDTEDKEAEEADAEALRFTLEREAEQEARITQDFIDLMIYED
jgi:hypothetical protein